MRPSRTQVELVGIALGAVAFKQVPYITGFEPGSIVDNSYFLLIQVCFLTLGVTYAYYHGRTGRAGPPPTVAREFFVAGLVGVVVEWTIRLDFGQSLVAYPEPEMLVILILNMVVADAVPFALAGLAGVPLGAMYGRGPTPDSAADADSETVAAADN